jgi:hypothetical protein
MTQETSNSRLISRIAGYALFTAAGNMKVSYLELQTKLQAEQCRLLAFAEVVGLLDWKE